MVPRGEAEERGGNRQKLRGGVNSSKGPSTKLTAERASGIRREKLTVWQWRGLNIEGASELNPLSF